MAGCVALLCLILAEPAVGQRDCQAPPGRSGLDQYCESLPGATGDRGPGAGGGSGRDVSPSTRQRLERSGPAGQALLGMIGGASDREKQSAADGDGGGKSSREKSAGEDDGNGKSSRRSARGAKEEAADEPSNNVLSAVRSAADSGASAGPVFIWVLIAVAVAIAGIAWIRYRIRGGAG